MGFEKRSYSQSLTERVKNTAIGLGVGALSIGMGLTSYGELIPQNSAPIYKEYKTKNPQNVAIIKDVEKAGDFFLNYGLPVIFIGVGAGAVVWGAGNATNIRYRR